MAPGYVGRHRGAVGARSTGLRAAGRTLRHTGATLVVSATAVGGYVLSTSAPDRTALVDNPVAMERVHTSVAVSADAPLAPAVLDGEKATANQQVNARIVAVQVAQAAAAAQLEAERKAETDRAARAAEREALLANARSNPKAVAAALVAERGWNDGQFQCLVRLWTKESNWSYTATNRSSGAYGIPQSLPGSKMASVAADWRTNPVTQITWGLKYIAQVYGTPCSAWAHSQRTNWY